MRGLEGHKEQVWVDDMVQVRDMLVLEGCMGLVLVGCKGLGQVHGKQVLVGYKGRGQVRGKQVQGGYKGLGRVHGKLHRQVFDKLHK